MHGLVSITSLTLDSFFFFFSFLSFFSHRDPDPPPSSSPQSPSSRIRYVRTYDNRESICTDACYHQSLHTHSTLRSSRDRPYLSTFRLFAFPFYYTRTHNRPQQRYTLLPPPRRPVRKDPRPPILLAKAITRKSSHIYPSEAKTS